MVAERDKGRDCEKPTAVGDFSDGKGEAKGKDDDEESVSEVRKVKACETGWELEGVAMDGGDDDGGDDEEDAGDANEKHLGSTTAVADGGRRVAEVGRENAEDVLALKLDGVGKP